MLWGFILKSQRKPETTDFRGKPPINQDPPTSENFYLFKKNLINWLFFLLPVAHSSTLHPPHPSHHQEHPHKEILPPWLRGGRILSTRKEAQNGAEAMGSRGRAACASWEGWRSWKLLPDGKSWKSWCIWIDLPVGAAMNKLGWVQRCANVCEPDKVTVANSHHQPRALRVNFSLCSEFSAGL